VQDKQGLIWLATQDGLNKYDGNSFEVFKKQPFDTTALPSNCISDLLIDRKGNVWLASKKGLYRYHIKAKSPDINILIYGAIDDGSVFQSLKAGACGCLTKNTRPTKLLEAIKEAHRGGAPMSSNVARMVVGSFNNFKQLTTLLTFRECDVLNHLCQGKSCEIV